MDIIAPSQHISSHLFSPLRRHRTHLQSLEVHAERPRVCLRTVEREVRARGLGLSHVREPIHGEALVFFASANAAAVLIEGRGRLGTRRAFRRTPQVRLKLAQSRCQLARAYPYFTQPHLTQESASRKLFSRGKSSAKAREGSVVSASLFRCTRKQYKRLPTKKRGRFCDSRQKKSSPPPQPTAHKFISFHYFGHRRAAAATAL